MAARGGGGGGLRRAGCLGGREGVKHCWCALRAMDKNGRNESGQGDAYRAPSTKCLLLNGYERGWDDDDLVSCLLPQDWRVGSCM